MKGIMLCSADGNYRGIVRTNPISDYLYNKEIGKGLQGFLNYSVDPETQEISYSLANIDECTKATKLLSSVGENCETVIYCTCDEEVNFSDSEFLGYDVCSTAVDDSPLALGLIVLPPDEYKKDAYSDFYKSLNEYELKTYFDDLNEYGLLNNYETALKLSERCHNVSTDCDGIFYAPSYFEPYKVYIIKSI